MINKHFWSVVCSAIIFGISGILVRLVNREVPVYTQILLRTVFALAFVYVLLKLKKSSLKIQKEDVIPVLISGIFGYTLMIIFFTLAIIHTSIANTYFLLYTEPVIVAIFGYVLLKEKMSLKLAISLLASLFGIFLIFEMHNASMLGDGFALLSGLSYAFYVLSNRSLSQKYDSAVPLFYTMSIAIVILLPLVIIKDQPNLISFSSEMWLFLLIFGFSNFLAYVFLNYGLRELSANSASLILVIEPVSSAFFAFMFFQEHPGVRMIIGSFFIILSIINLSFRYQIPFLFAKKTHSVE